MAVSSGFLQTQSSNGGSLLLGTISNLNPDVTYNVTIFAAAETFGLTFQVSTAPMREAFVSPFLLVFPLDLKILLHLGL